MIESRDISVLLIDDEVCFRKGLITLLDFYNNQNSRAINIVGEASSVDRLVKLTVENLQI